MVEHDKRFELIDKQYHELRPNTPEWDEHRERCFNASEIPSVLGCSPHTSRSELLRQKATGEKPEVGHFQQRIYDKGHNFEAIARPWAEEILEADLYSVIISANVDGLLLSASYDGLCISDQNVWEHKQLNKDNVIQVESECLHLMYRAQMEQQLLLCGAKSALFMVSDGKKETMRACYYHADLELRRLIIDSWKQFREDLQNYEIKEIKVKPVAADIMQLPALNIQIHGGISASNLDSYKFASDAFLMAINTDLKTDEDFATAEKVVKFLKDTQDKIKLVKEQALSQTVDIELIFKTLTQMESEYAAKRLEVDKLVKAEKENSKNRICNEAVKALFDFVTLANKRLGKPYIVHNVNFREVIKGKRTITSIEGAASDALASAKIEINRLEELISLNLACHKAHSKNYEFLFMDLNNLVHKESETFRLIVNQRIADHKAKEKIRLDAERDKLKLELEQKAADKLKADKKREDDKKAEDAQKELDKQKKADRELEVTNALTEKVNNLVTHAKAKPKQAGIIFGVPSAPSNISSPATTTQIPRRVLSIEQVANYIAVKFCHRNALNPDEIAILIDQIEKGYKEVLKGLDK